jgi:hypothetical protein
MSLISHERAAFSRNLAAPDEQAEQFDLSTIERVQGMTEEVPAAHIVERSAYLEDFLEQLWSRPRRARSS